jgi:N-acetyl-anhydromuramyl-L-alanine amidase AmpD
MERANQKKEIMKGREALDLSSIIQHNFHQKHYVKVAFPKNQITLHHTVSGEGIGGDISWWLNDGKRIGTPILIARDGTIHQTFSSKYWAYHLGENGKDHAKLGLKYRRNDMESIGIEIDSWGGLTKKDGKWYSCTGVLVEQENVQEYPEGFRGFYGYEKYTDAQIESLAKLLMFFSEKYLIPLDYNDDIWDINPRALSGKKGVYTHVSYRSDKSDCHPQPELIEMLKSLK